MIVFFSLVIILYSSHNRYHRNIIIAGGYGDGYRDDILEYDIMEDTFHETGKMLQHRDDHAVSVVQIEDYSMWCQ